MTIQIKFKKIEDSEGEYYVSLDDYAEEFVGKGHQGRVNASGKVAQNKMSKEVKKKWLEALREAETKCESTFSVEISRSSFILNVDEQKFPKTTTIDELAVVISQIEAPTKDHRPPGR